MLTIVGISISVVGQDQFLCRSFCLQTVTRWAEQSSEHFRFTLKVPKRLSHQFQQFQTEELQLWLDLIAPLADKLALGSFTIARLFFTRAFKLAKTNAEPHCAHPLLSLLKYVIRYFLTKQNMKSHSTVCYGILQRRGLFLTAEPCFSVPATTAALLDAQRKKPYLPVHAVALTNSPLLRFVGTDDMAVNQHYYQPWLGKVRQWLDEGKTPFCFFHSADNLTAPVLARQFVMDLGIDHPILAPWPQDQIQLSLL